MARCFSEHCKTENAADLRTCAACGLALPGSVIGSRYEVLELLGRGGMGIVYKARDRVLEDVVALKLLSADNLPPDVAARFPEMVQRFRSEIRLARRVTHRNVCRIHEYGEDGATRYLSMAFVDGLDLKQILKKQGALPPEQAFDVALGVAEALEAIHEEGIVHRDLKTPNIMRDHRGVVKVMDFGIAKPLETEAGSGMTATGMIVGTPDYLSPEQARAVPVDSRSDLYSLGVVIFELFTGRLPFRGTSRVDTILKHIQEPPPLEGPAAAGLPPSLVPVLRKALAKTPDERYVDAREMLEALKEARAQWRASAAAQPVAPSVIRGGALAEPQPIPVTTPMPTPVPTAVPTSVPTPVPMLTPTVVPLPASTPRPAVQPAAATPTTPMAIAAPLRPLAPPLTASTSQTGPGRREAARDPVPAVRATWNADDLEDLPAADPPDLPRPRRTLFRVAAGVVGSLVLALVLVVSSRWSSSPAADPSVMPSTPVTPTGPLAKPSSPLDEGSRPSVAPPRARSGASSEHRETIGGPSRAGVAIPKPPEPAPTSQTRATAAPSTTEGVLQVVVVPWADVTVDGAAVTTGPTRGIRLAAGPHIVRFTHPDYQPVQRRVTVKAGETVSLTVDLPEEAVPTRK